MQRRAPSPLVLPFFSRAISTMTALPAHLLPKICYSMSGRKMPKKEPTTFASPGKGSIPLPLGVAGGYIGPTSQKSLGRLLVCYKFRPFIKAPCLPFPLDRLSMRHPFTTVPSPAAHVPPPPCDCSTGLNATPSSWALGLQQHLGSDGDQCLRNVMSWDSLGGFISLVGIA